MAEISKEIGLEYALRRVGLADRSSSEDDKGRTTQELESLGKKE